MNRGDLLKQRINGEVFMLDKKHMNMLVNMGENNTIKTAVSEVVYEELNNIAIISIDGSMSRKSEQGLCMSVFGYDEIEANISRAEGQPNIDTLIFRVDSPGGHVAGVDDLEDRIFKTKLKTITLYENTGASAAIYAFSASDEIYATKTTEVGSIGVIAGMTIPKENEDDPVQLVIVSQNAENKVCDMEGDCFDRIQTKLNVYEEMFLSTVSKNTGLSIDAIVSGFNNGDTLFAKEALELGFLDGIMTFHELLNREVTGQTIPTAQSDNLANSKQRNNMEFTQDNFNTLLDENSVYKAANATINARFTAKESELTDAIAAKEAAVTDIKAEAIVRLAEATEYGATLDTMKKMIVATDSTEATAILLASEPTQALGGDDEVDTGNSRAEKLKLKAIAQLGRK